MAAPFYRFFTSDYLVKAGHLSLLEHGVYRLLIDRYMVTGGPLPFDLPHLYRLLHATSKEEQQAVQTVLEEFFTIDGATLRHRRCDAELAFQDRVTNRQHDNALQRWGKGRDKNQQPTSHRIPVAMPLQCQPEPEPEPEPEKPPVIRSNQGHKPEVAANKKPEPRATRFGLSEIPNEWITDFSRICPQASLDRTFAMFSDHWAAKAGKDAAKLDWRATWRNWCRREAESAPKPRAGNLRHSAGVQTAEAAMRVFNLTNEGEPHG